MVHDGEFHVRRVTLLALLPHLTHTAGLGCRVQGSGCRVQGAGFRVQGSGFRVQASKASGSRPHRGLQRDFLNTPEWDHP